MAEDRTYVVDAESRTHSVKSLYHVTQYLHLLLEAGGYILLEGGGKIIIAANSLAQSRRYVIDAETRMAEIEQESRTYSVNPMARQSTI